MQISVQYQFYAKFTEIFFLVQNVQLISKILARIRVTAELNIT